MVEIIIFLFHLPISFIQLHQTPLKLAHFNRNVQIVKYYIMNCILCQPIHFKYFSESNLHFIYLIIR